MKTTSLILLAAACAALLAPPAGVQDYHSNDITPAGTSAGKLTGISGGRQAGGATQQGTSYIHAELLSGNALSAVDLQPATGFYTSMATCLDDFQQGGWGYSLSGVHAMVWSGSAASYVDLHPSGYTFSYCLGVHNGEQVGYAQSQVYFITASHAFCWHGSAASAVDLHSGISPYIFSRALGCHDGEEVGYISTIAYAEGDSLGYHTGSRATRWAGTAASAVDLHPVGFDASEALCTSGTQEAGWGYLALGTSHLHALLWSGTPDSVVDLHPATYTETKVTAMNATQQVGEGWVGTPGAVGSVRHALLWTGTADTVVDLNQYLPAGYTHGVATGIDASGNIVGYAYNTFVAGLTMPPDAVAVVFAPGAAPASGLASISISPTAVAPGDAVQGVVTLGAAAPAGGVTISFLSLAPTVITTPATLVIPEGSSNATFGFTTGGATLTVPTTVKLYATDGAVSNVASLAVTPVVKLAGISGNPVEGGFTTYGSVTLSIPAQVGGAAISLSSGNPALLTVPASLAIAQGYPGATFSMTTSPVTTATSVPVTATFNGQTVTGSVALSPAPVVALAALTFPTVIGGQTVVGTVTLNNFPRSASGAVISLTSGDTGSLQVPATVTVPQGAYSASFTATTSVVSGLKGVSVKAVYNGGNLSTTVSLYPIPTVTITQAQYLTDTKMLKVAATTTYANSILTYGGDPTTAPFGTMQFELGSFTGSMIMDVPPAVVTVWNSNGGFATLPVTIKTSTTSGGGGGGGGGGGTTTTASTYKLSISKNGKGTVTTSPTGTDFAPGTVVTLTATPDVGSPWIGWSGDATGTARTISITMNKGMSVTANFK